MSAELRAKKGLNPLLCSRTLDQAHHLGVFSSGKSDIVVLLIDNPRSCVCCYWSSRNEIFKWTVLSLSVLFFVVTGIQYWITGYLVEVIGSPRQTVGLAFVMISATAPTGGVLFGGWLIDRLGG